MKNEQVLFEIKLSNLLKELGVSPVLRGYNFLKEACTIVYFSNKYISLTKELYPTVATKFNTTTSKVERTMRFAIESSLEKPPLELLHKVFGNCISMNNRKLTCGEFIYGVVSYLQIQDKVEC